MNTTTLWTALRNRFGAHKPTRGLVTLQHLGLSDRDLSELRPLLTRVGDELDVSFDLQGHTGDVVLLDVPFAARLSPQLVHAFAEGRPVVLVGSTEAEAERMLDAAQRQQRRLQSLLRQFRDVALVRARSGRFDDEAWTCTEAGQLAGAGDRMRSQFDPQFDSRVDAEQLQAAVLQQGQQDVLQQVMQGLAQPDATTCSASYGPEANILFDFRSRLVFVDLLAQQQLRVHRELPQPAPGARPQAEALVREFDEMLWDMGLAAGPFPLLDQPADWWHSPLQLAADIAIERYTRLPRHLDLARRLAQGPATPSELRRHACVGILELRRFIQAALMVGLVRWAPGPLVAPLPATDRHDHRGDTDHPGAAARARLTLTPGAAAPVL